MSAGADLYLPCLLTRLQDDYPGSPAERGRPLNDAAALKQEIIANISLILNSRSHVSAQSLPEELRGSVLDFGISDFCGCEHSERKLEQLKTEIARALAWYEPRIDPASVRIESTEAAPAAAHGGSVFALKIYCEVKVAPLEGEILFVSYLDLESGSAEVAFQE